MTAAAMATFRTLSSAPGPIITSKPAFTAFRMASLPELIALSSEFVKIKQYYGKNGDIFFMGASMSSRAMRVGRAQ